MLAKKLRRLVLLQAAPGLDGQCAVVGGRSERDPRGEQLLQLCRELQAQGGSRLREGGRVALDTLDALRRLGQ
jgi:hypothetical protein